METKDDSIVLKGAETYVPHGAKDAYLIQAGTILIYIVPWKKGEQGRKLLLCEQAKGNVVPAFVYRDQDYQEWRFAFVAKGQAILKKMPSSSTTILLKRFAQSAGLQNVQEEGFSNSIVEFYHSETVKDSVFLERGVQMEPEIRMASYGVIKNAFETDSVHIDGSDLTYRAVAYACHTLKEQVVSYERVGNYCGNQIDVPGVAHASGLICREVILDADWWHRDCGVIIGTINADPVTCVPYRKNKYKIYYPESGRAIPLTTVIANTIQPKAYIIERTFPNQKLERTDLIKFGVKCVPQRDLVTVFALGLISALIGILLPTLNQKIYDEYIPLGNLDQLFQICIVIASFMIGDLFFSIVKNIAEFRVQCRVGYEFQDAVYHRVFHMPEKFFRQYESADLAQRIASVAGTVNRFLQASVIAGISTIFSLVYLVRMFLYSSKLTGVALVILVIYIIILIVIARTTVKYERTEVQQNGIASSKLYQYLNGIEKIRLAGAEEQSIYEYMIPFSAQQTAQIRKNRISEIGDVLIGIATTLFSIAFYFAVVKFKLNISMGQFVGFNTALGSFSAAVLQMVNNGISIIQMRPAYERLKPIMETAPEDHAESELAGHLSGEIDVNHVSFAYGENTPSVLTDISLHISPGEYVGIVGTSGCGKTTLLRLLLGFESPSEGSISYDRRNLTSLDKYTFRQNLGVVLQNGKLISGSIYENITITAPSATSKDVEAAIEAVGLKEDIAQMPMGMHTILSENSGTISGGQQQRILIARAIIRHPSILIFDEATSALDNVTQATVCESLDKMNITRIVVAHRLSTIRTCNRIIVLNQGRIAEEGTYDELMENKGLFYQLAKRQISE